MWVLTNKKITSIIFAVIIIIVLIALFTKGSGGSLGNGANSKPIKIGAVLSLTGDASPWGEYGKNGINLAVKQINEKGGINGRKVEVIIEDDHTDGKQGVSAFNKLIDLDGVDGIIGGVFDFTTQPLIPLAQSKKIAFISPHNFRIEGGFDLNSQSFVMFTDFSTVIKSLKNYLEQSGTKKLAVVHFKSTFGNEIAKTLNGVMKDLGRGEIVDEAYTEIGNNDFKTTIIKLKQANVDTVFLDMLANDPVNFLKRAKELGFNPTIITHNGPIDSFANETDKSPLENAVILNWEVTSSQFSALYKKEYGISPTKSADKYFDAVYVLANSIANSDDQSKVASYIESHSFTTPNTTISFTPNHTVISMPVEVQIFKNGNLVPWK
ncbi:MAG: ABC transporter substrate-binding protein [Candidatus Taylorbacteria bacterium]|nr:ABC transporter substrate-binding protein [Candidatus Taylorbacteria bacterium]